MAVSVLLTMVAGFMAFAFRFPTVRSRNLYFLLPVCANSFLLAALILRRPEGTLTILRLAEGFELALRMDGLSCVFCGLLAFLWPLATLYAFEYMEHEHAQKRFFSLYTVSYGVCVGIALSANLITLYFFYELLTLATIPLVAHEMDRRAVYAGRKYMIYSFGGATLALAGILILFQYGGGDLRFIYGGHLPPGGQNGGLLLLGWFFTFLGFGVKAAVFPLHGWLPTAGVAPTPVTALLHAVAVVKAGVFASIRSTFFAFGPDFLSGSWAQTAAMVLTVCTILYGSSMALREQHIKRRLAYSTVSNLSYILFGMTMLTVPGLTAALSHMLFHGIMKITLFFVAGTVICKTGREYVDELEGLGRRMPVTFAAFAVGSMALTGIPLLPGFLSKLYLLAAAFQLDSAPALAGALALVISAMLTGAYLFTVVLRAFFPADGFRMETLKDIHDPSWRMKLPYFVLCAAMVVSGSFSGPLFEVLGKIAAGVF